MYMLSYFGLGNIGISLDRYRQLFMYAKKIEERFGYSYIEDKLLPIGFVRYEKWKGKRLSFISVNKRSWSCYSQFIFFSRDNYALPLYQKRNKGLNVLCWDVLSKQNGNIQKTRWYGMCF